MYKRTLFYTILPQLQHKNALVITGMRQVGKSTLMRQLAEAWNGRQAWFDFDNPLDQLMFENVSYHSIYEDLRREAGAERDERFLVCIDEIQNFPGVTKIIKYLIDHHRVKFIVTGSSNYYLRNLFPESLSGRKFLYVLRTLSFREYLHFNDRLPESGLQPDPVEALNVHSPSAIVKRRELYHEYMEFGGFPEVTLTSDPHTKRLILRNIFASFFEKDIKVFTELKNVKELRDIILLLGARNGNILDITRLSSELGINRVKVYAYLEFLEGTFFLQLVPKFTRSVDRSVAGGKKVYFSDTGILNLVTKTSEGQLFETSVANQLLDYGTISFYNVRNTAEIDFILDHEKAFEVKLKAIEPDLIKLQKLAKSINIEKAYIVSNTPVALEKVVYPWFF